MPKSLRELTALIEFELLNYKTPPIGSGVFVPTKLTRYLVEVGEIAQKSNIEKEAALLYLKRLHENQENMDNRELFRESLHQIVVTAYGSTDISKKALDVIIAWSEGAIEQEKLRSYLLALGDISGSKSKFNALSFDEMSRLAAKPVVLEDRSLMSSYKSALERISKENNELKQEAEQMLIDIKNRKK